DDAPFVRCGMVGAFAPFLRTSRLPALPVAACVLPSDRVAGAGDLFLGWRRGTSRSFPPCHMAAFHFADVLWNGGVVLWVLGCGGSWPTRCGSGHSNKTKPARRIAPIGCGCIRAGESWPTRSR